MSGSVTPAKGTRPELAVEAGKALVGLAEEANEHHRLCEESYRSALEHAWHAGMALRSAQSLLEHGSWLPWLADNFAGSKSTAYRYIEVAAKFPRVGSLPDTSIRQALAPAADAGNVKCPRCGKLVSPLGPHGCRQTGPETNYGPRQAKRNADTARSVAARMRIYGNGLLQSELDPWAARQGLGDEAAEIAKELRKARAAMTWLIKGLEGRLVQSLGVPDADSDANGQESAL